MIMYASIFQKMAVMKKCVGGQYSENDEAQMALLTWFLLFLLRMQAKHYIPDVALNSLLKFLYAFFLILGRYSEFVGHVPASSRNFFKLTEEFTRFVVCRSAHTMESCVEKHGKAWNVCY